MLSNISKAFGIIKSLRIWIYKGHSTIKSKPEFLALVSISSLISPEQATNKGLITGYELFLSESKNYIYSS